MCIVKSRQFFVETFSCTRNSESLIGRFGRLLKFLLTYLNLSNPGNGLIEQFHLTKVSSFGNKYTQYGFAQSLHRLDSSCKNNGASKQCILTAFLSIEYIATRYVCDANRFHYSSVEEIF